MLAFLPQDELQATLRRMPREALTPHTITSRTEFAKHLAQVRQQGLAHAPRAARSRAAFAHRGDLFLRHAAVAVPVEHLEQFRFRHFVGRQLAIAVLVPGREKL
jgi:DNA-binding IclR family transcriptional regulator